MPPSASSTPPSASSAPDDGAVLCTRVLPGCVGRVSIPNYVTVGDRFRSVHLVAMQPEAELNGMFVDPSFPADDSSLYCDYTTPLSSLLGEVTWLRPQEICEHPRLFPDDPVEANPKQGILGDCWLLCACSMLLKNQHLMDKVFPQDQPLWGDRGYHGGFRFQFWRHGHWIEIRVDDRLPCVNGTPCFSRCQSPKAFWVALLEKAYAKLHGSYEGLWAGQVCEAMVDLSGTIAERWSLKEVKSTQQSSNIKTKDTHNGKSLSELSEELKMQCSISCSIHSATPGVPELGQFHAMSVMEWTNVTTTNGENVQLIRIRNPWGRRSWGGTWKESGSGWDSLEPSDAQALLSRTTEGEFWMDKTEFLQEFHEVTVSYPISEDGHLQSIYTGNFLPHSHQIGGRWVKGRSAGGCRNNSTFSINPKYWLKVSERGEVLLSLLQCVLPEFPAEGNARLAIALHVWKVETKRFNLTQTLSNSPLASHTHAYDREVVLHTHLSPGFYLLIPSTFLQEAEGRFLLRVYSSCSSSLSVMKSTPALQPCSEGDWKSISSHGSWIVNSTAGGGRNFPTHESNPRIPLSVTYDPGGNNVRVTLRQNRPEDALHAIGFHIYQVPDGGSCSSLAPSVMSPVASCVPHAHSQEVSASCHLQPGEYAIIPSTYQPDLSSQFTVTLSCRIQRKAFQCQEYLGRAIQEVSSISVMRQ